MPAPVLRPRPWQTARGRGHTPRLPGCPVSRLCQQLRARCCRSPTAASSQPDSSAGKGRWWAATETDEEGGSSWTKAMAATGGPGGRKLLQGQAGGLGRCRRAAVPRNGPGPPQSRGTEATGTRSAPKEASHRAASLSQGGQPPLALCPRAGTRLFPGHFPFHPPPQQPEGSHLSLQCPNPALRAAEETEVPGNAPATQPCPWDKAPRPRRRDRLTAGCHWTLVRREHPDTAPGWAPMTWTPRPGLRQGRFCPGRAPKQDTTLPAAFFCQPGALRGSVFPRLQLTVLAADTEQYLLDWGALQQALLPSG